MVFSPFLGTLAHRVRIQLTDEVRAVHTSQCCDYAIPLFRFVPEEKLALCQLLLLGAGRENRFQCVRMQTRVPSLGAHRHGGGGKVLYLLQMEVELFGDDSQFGHIFFTASGMTADEVGNELLVEALVAIDAVKYPLEFIELLEGRFAHQGQDRFTGVLGGHLQTPADVVGYKFVSIFTGSLIDGFVVAVMKQQVVPYTTAYETFFDTLHGIHTSVDVQ